MDHGKALQLIRDIDLRLAFLDAGMTAALADQPAEWREGRHRKDRALRFHVRRSVPRTLA